MGCRTRGYGENFCIVCGGRLWRSKQGHKCPPRVQAKVDRDALRDTDPDPPDPTLEQRLADGFRMLEGEPPADCCP